jgi:hypothetical protein
VAQKQEYKKMSEILMITDHDIEVVLEFHIPRNCNDEIEDTKAKFWLLIKPVTFCKLHLHLNKSTKITK